MGRCAHPARRTRDARRHPRDDERRDPFARGRAVSRTDFYAWANTRLFLFETPPEAFLHPMGEPTGGFAVPSGPGSLPGAGSAPTRSITERLSAPTSDEEQNARAEHHKKAEQADDREPARLHRQGDTRDQQRQTHYEQRTGLQPSTAACHAQPTASDGRGELGILSIERALDLIEHALLVLGEWHGTSPGTKTVAADSSGGNDGGPTLDGRLIS